MAYNARPALRIFVDEFVRFFDGEPISLKQLLEKVDANERAWLKELSNGIFRKLEIVERILAASCHRPVAEVDPYLRAILLISAYRVYYMQTPDYAILNDAHTLCRRPDEKKFINGVMRNLTKYRKPETHFIFKGKDKIMRTMINNSYPQWFVETLAEDRPDDFEELLTQMNQPTPIMGYIDGKLQDVDNLTLFLEQGGSVISPGGFLALNNLPLNPQDNVLDIAAAPGTKALWLSQQKIKHLIANDIDLNRLKLIEQEASRLKLTTPNLCIANGTKLPFKSNSFDKIILDTPCSGTGVIGKHPEGKYTKNIPLIEQYQELQTALLDQAFDLLKPKGILCYSTCSIFNAENDHQIATFLKRNTRAKIFSSQMSLISIDQKIEHEIQESIEKTTYGFFLNPAKHSLAGFYWSYLTKE